MSQKDLPKQPIRRRRTDKNRTHNAAKLAISSSKMKEKKSGEGAQAKREVSIFSGGSMAGQFADKPICGHSVGRLLSSRTLQLETAWPCLQPSSADNWPLCNNQSSVWSYLWAVGSMGLPTGLPTPYYFSTYSYSGFYIFQYSEYYLKALPIWRPNYSVVLFVRLSRQGGAEFLETSSCKPKICNVKFRLPRACD